MSLSFPSSGDSGDSHSSAAGRECALRREQGALISPTGCENGTFAWLRTQLLGPNGGRHDGADEVKEGHRDQQDGNK